MQDDEAASAPVSWQFLVKRINWPDLHHHHQHGKSNFLSLIE
jgi:hypothetical protein